MHQPRIYYLLNDHCAKGRMWEPSTIVKLVPDYDVPSRGSCLKSDHTFNLHRGANHSAHNKGMRPNIAFSSIHTQISIAFSCPLWLGENTATMDETTDAPHETEQIKVIQADEWVQYAGYFGTVACPLSDIWCRNAENPVSRGWFKRIFLPLWPGPPSRKTCYSRAPKEGDVQYSCMWKGNFISPQPSIKFFGNYGYAQFTGLSKRLGHVLCDSLMFVSWNKRWTCPRQVQQSLSKPLRSRQWCKMAHIVVGMYHSLRVSFTGDRGCRVSCWQFPIDQSLYLLWMYCCWIKFKCLKSALKQEFLRSQRLYGICTIGCFHSTLLFKSV